jgi:bifunctional ADP-heptose synthase (sugar kinase/adenylyltransferase)
VDTRGKILSGAEAAARVKQWSAAGSEVQIAAGWFDPLLAASAEILAAWKRPGARLLVVLADPPEAILPARARAEMVASLRVVDAVTAMAEAEAIPAARDFGPDHELLRAGFVGHVLQRMK